MTEPQTEEPEFVPCAECGNRFNAVVFQCPQCGTRRPVATGRKISREQARRLGVADIRMGMVGEITAGADIGRYVVVQDDFEATGGFLIFTSGNPEMAGQVFDNWVENTIDLDLFFQQSEWSVRWSDSRPEWF